MPYRDYGSRNSGLPVADRRKFVPGHYVDFYDSGAGECEAMAGTRLVDLIHRYDLDDKGVDAITSDEAGRVRIVFDLFHCDDPERDDETKEYRLTAIFRPQDVVVHEGELWHEEGVWLGTVLDLQPSAGAMTLRIGIEWRSLARDAYSWTSLSLLDGPLQADETVSPRVR
mgnify:CR=1 FL=1